jgi:hypothetical protein
VTSVDAARGSTTAGRVGPIGTLLVGVALLGFALSVDFPRAAHGFKGDEATYYTLSYSLARDYDFAFTRADLLRVWDEFPTGPEGIFLKRGRHIGLHRTAGFPWLRPGWTSDGDRLYYGKSFIYPLVAAPFVKVAGTNGFLVLHALLLTACFAAAVAWLQKKKLLQVQPIRDFVGAVSVGIHEGTPVLDLDYAEDSSCGVDMNVVMTGAGNFVELQGTAEGETFGRAQLDQLLALAQSGIRELIAHQRRALGLT